jgi:hypothetical protein
VFPGAAEQAVWTAFAEKATRRYGYNGVFWTTHTGLPYLPVQEWELWNEPNNAGGTAAEYGGYLKWAGPAVQHASESFGGQPTRVLFGGLLAFNGGTNYQTFLANAITASGTAAFTGAGFHPYALEGKRLDSFEKAVNGMRTTLTANAGSGKTLSITEFGWPVEREYAISEYEAATLMKQSVNWLNSHEAALNLKAIDYYNYRDSAFAQTWAYRSGLRDEVGNFRKAWFAFEELEGVANWPVPHVALQANTGTLFVATASGGGVNTSLGMKAGTSPSIGQVGGSYQVAFQGNTGTLFLDSPGGGVNTGYGMAAGTSPSISPLEGGTVAFQSNANQLWTYKSGGTVANSGLAMAPGTSPSIARKYNGNYVIAYQGSDGTLHVYEPGAGVLNTGVAMAAGTSPAVAAIDGNFAEARFVVAVNSSAGELTFYADGGSIVHSGYGMMGGTNPGIGSIPSGIGRYEAPFQANSGYMWLYMPYGTVASTGLGMAPGSGPAVTGLSDSPCCTSATSYHPFEITMQVNTSQMWTYEPNGAIVNSLLGMAAGTSPSISPG